MKTFPYQVEYILVGDKHNVVVLASASFWGSVFKALSLESQFLCLRNANYVVVQKFEPSMFAGIYKKIPVKSLSRVFYSNINYSCLSNLELHFTKHICSK